MRLNEGMCFLKEDSPFNCRANGGGGEAVMVDPSMLELSSSVL